MFHGIDTKQFSEYNKWHPNRAFQIRTRLNSKGATEEPMGKVKGNEECGLRRKKGEVEGYPGVVTKITIYRC